MAINRYVRVGLSLDPRVEIRTPCDEFNVGENDDIQVFLGSELWAYFPASIYVYMEDVEEPDAPAPDTEDDDEDDDEEPDADADDKIDTVAVPTDVDLGKSVPNGTVHGVGEEVVSQLLN